MKTKTQFLDSLRNKKGKYKRYNGAPIRYAGGKSRAVGYIIERIPEGVNKLVSPFIGAGSVEVACVNELGMEVQGYDIFDMLCNFWDVLLNHNNALFQKLRYMLPTPMLFKINKYLLERHWKGDIVIDDPVDVASIYYYTHSLSYGPQFLGWMSSLYKDSPTPWLNMTQRIKKFSAPGLSVKEASFETVMPEHQGDFMYCDPPYYLDSGSVFTGIYPQRNFPIHHKGFDHERLRDILYEHRGGFLLSYNDCPIIREWYKDYEISTPSWQYSLGQGETRVGANRSASNTNHVKKSHELLIYGEAW